MEPCVCLSWVEALLIHRVVIKNRPVSSLVNRLTPAWLIRSNSRSLKNGPAKTPLLMELAQRQKQVRRAALCSHTPQISRELIQVSRAILKWKRWSAEESQDVQVLMWGLREEGFKEKTMDKSSTSLLGQFRDFLMCVCVCIRPSWRLLADEEALHKNLRGARPQGSALSHADTSFSDSVELSPLSADHTHTHKQS